MKKSLSNLRNFRIQPNQRKAVLEAKKRLAAAFPIREVIIFGSVAREEATEDSDLDLLVVTERSLSHKERGKMSDIVFDVDLKYHTNISLVIVDADSWYNGVFPLTSLYNEVARDGVYLIRDSGCFPRQDVV